MDEKETNEPLSFPVDLNKSEYLAFARLYAQLTGAARRGGGWMSLLCVLLAVELLLRLQNPAAAPGESRILAGLLLLTLLAGVIAVPLIRRLGTRRVYEQAIAGGQSFAGIFTITPHMVEKKTGSGSLTLLFREGVRYVETARMQVFLRPGGPSIVLPARCLTPQDADRVREIAVGAIPPENCRILQPVQAELSDRRPIPEIRQTPPLLTVDVSYRIQEMDTLMHTLRRRGFVTAFLPYVPAAFALALMLGLIDGAAVGAIAFWVILLLTALLLVFTLRRRFPTPGEETEPIRFELQFTENAVVVDGGDLRGKIYLPWTAVSHAVEGEDAVEFYNRRQYIYLPKRCIEDMEQFRSMVEHNRRPR